MVKVRSIILYLLAVASVLLFLIPLFGLILTSLQPMPYVWDLTNMTLRNYLKAFDPTLGYGFFQAVRNSIIIVSISTALSVTISCFAAFSLTKFQFKQRRDIAFFILSLNMYPAIIPVIPIYLIGARLHLNDTYLYMILLYTYANTPFATWLLRGFLKGVPKEIEEASLIDGCSRLFSLFRVTLPLAAGGIAVTTVFNFIFTWNEFTMACVLTGSRAVTLPVAVGKTIGQHEIHWGPLSAAGTLAIIPSLALSFIVQKYIVSGLTMGAVKG